MLGSCLMIALKGPQLLKRERDFIVKNQIAGVILFQRNIKSFEQVFQLNKQIKGLTQSSPLIAVDMEGGLVNRFSHLKKGGDWPSLLPYQQQSRRAPAPLLKILSILLKNVLISHYMGFMCYTN